MKNTINLNDTVRVKLNEPGKAKLIYDAAELRRRFPKLSPFTLPEPDAEGYHRFQLARVNESL